MTTSERRLLFKQATGKYAPGTVPGREIPASAIASQSEYIVWLEDYLEQITKPTDTVLVVSNGKIGSSSTKIGG